MGLGFFFSFFPLLLFFQSGKGLGINLQVFTNHTQADLWKSTSNPSSSSFLIALPTLTPSSGLPWGDPKDNLEKRGTLFLFGCVPGWSAEASDVTLNRSIGLKSDEKETSPGCKKSPQADVSCSLCPQGRDWLSNCPYDQDPGVHMPTIWDGGFQTAGRDPWVGHQVTSMDHVQQKRKEKKISESFDRLD